MMKNLLLLGVIILITFSYKEKFTIMISESPDLAETFIALELSKYLSDIYPGYEFPITDKAAEGKTIYLNVADKTSGVPDNKEAYLVKSDGDNAYILSRGNSGLIYGVYGVLEKLGCRFLLDNEYIPERAGEFNFTGWELKNEPLVSERYANPWEVYLEGCASWDLVKRKQYIRNIQKMGFNSILVHAYGNNPMFTFTFNGKTKPIGYLTSSVKGRNWGQKHVNDVRRIPGDKSMFTHKVFGSEIAQVPDNERIGLTQKFMGEVFHYASERGVKVNFALDFDVLSNIPQDLVMTIPETDRYPVSYKGIGWMGEKPSTYWIPRLDKPEGYRYYKTQIEQILKLYPDISTYTLWRRGSKTIYYTMDYEDLPKDWKEEYNLFVKTHSGSDTLPQSVGTFTQRKLAIAYSQIFKELGRSNIQLAAGTWGIRNIETMDRFLPEHMKIIILDSDIKSSENNLKNPEWIRHLSSFLKEGLLVPIIWAHHDDGEYVGSPFKEFNKFNDLLRSLKSDGFAVIHWINRPLDLFFINHNRQNWKSTKNETAETTCQFLAEGIWYNNAETAHRMGKYLLNFWQGFPPMTWANSAFIFDRALSKFGSTDSILLKIDQRRTYLNTINTNQFSDRQKEFI